MKGKPDPAILAVVAPIVRGQVRDAFHHHPTMTRRFSDSIAKRIINDLACGRNAARLRAAILDTTETPP